MEQHTDTVEPYSEDQLSKIENTVRQAISKVQQDGLRIVSGDWGVRPYIEIISDKTAPCNWELSGKGYCCPIGAMLLTLQPNSAPKTIFGGNGLFETASATLDVSLEFIQEFVRGFDGSDLLIENNAQAKQGWELGNKLANEFLEYRRTKNGENNDGEIQET